MNHAGILQAAAPAAHYTAVAELGFAPPIHQTEGSYGQQATSEICPAPYLAALDMAGWQQGSPAYCKSCIFHVHSDFVQHAWTLLQVYTLRHAWQH